MKTRPYTLWHPSSCKGYSYLICKPPVLCYKNALSAIKVMSRINKSTLVFVVWTGCIILALPIKYHGQSMEISSTRALRAHTLCVPFICTILQLGCTLDIISHYHAHCWQPLPTYARSASCAQAIIMHYAWWVRSMGVVTMVNIKCTICDACRPCHSILSTLKPVFAQLYWCIALTTRLNTYMVLAIFAFTTTTTMTAPIALPLVHARGVKDLLMAVMALAISACTAGYYHWRPLAMHVVIASDQICSVIKVQNK